MAAPSEVVDYDPAWPERFKERHRRVMTAVGSIALAVEHVGSTAVPGLAAKPIIDMDVVVSSGSHVPQVIERLAQLGYEHRGDLGITGREAFSSPADLPPHWLYVVVSGSKSHLDHLEFRDYLREHPNEADQYAAKKREVAHLLKTDREAYVRAKGVLVEEMLGKARSGA